MRAEAEGAAHAALAGRLMGFNADAEARLGCMLMDIGGWAELVAGGFSGRVEMSVSEGGSEALLVLEGMREGVLHRGSLPPCPEADFRLTATAAGADPEDLERRMLQLLDDSGVEFRLERASAGPRRRRSSARARRARSGSRRPRGSPASSPACRR